MPTNYHNDYLSSRDNRQILYVCGFVFSYDQENVLLMLKQKPDWQKGRYNGIGGKVESGENSIDAMAREFDEEVSAKVLDWRLITSLECPGPSIDFFFSYGRIDKMEANECESVHVFPVDRLPQNCLPNLYWLIPMALSLTRGERCASFIIKEAYP